MTNSPSGASDITGIMDLPDGIVAITTTRYQVGEYTYDRLPEAMAEHARQHRAKTSGLNRATGLR